MTAGPGTDIQLRPILSQNRIHEADCHEGGHEGGHEDGPWLVWAVGPSGLAAPERLAAHGARRPRSGLRARSLRDARSLQTMRSEVRRIPFGANDAFRGSRPPFSPRSLRLRASRASRPRAFAPDASKRCIPTFASPPPAPFSKRMEGIGALFSWRVPPESDRAWRGGGGGGGGGGRARRTRS